VATVTVTVVAERLASVRARIERAGGDAGQVTVVAVTKGFGEQAVHAAEGAGLDDLGENYAQELVTKAAAARRARWHFLGTVQRNKVALVAPLVHLWQAVDRAAAGRPQMGGCPREETEPLVRQLRELGLDVRGLMAVGPAGPADAARPGFRWLAGTARRLGLAELSMGMTDDLEVAVQEGATMVRVGRALFGARPSRP
jgi:uncharacterized pyridoxal phosphate-containing UPF0001 family protein